MATPKTGCQECADYWERRADVIRPHLEALAASRGVAMAPTVTWYLAQVHRRHTRGDAL